MPRGRRRRQILPQRLAHAFPPFLARHTFVSAQRLHRDEHQVEIELGVVELGHAVRPREDPRVKIDEASVKVLASRDDANRRGRTRRTRTVRSTRSVRTNGCGFARLGRFLSPKGARGFVVGGVPGEGATFSLAAPASRCRRRGGVGGRGDGLHLRGLHFRGLGFREIGLIRSRSGLVEWARGGFLGRRSGLVVMLTAMGRRVRGGPQREPHGEGLRGRLGRRGRGRVQGTRGEARGVHRRQRFRSRRRGGHPHQSLLQLHLR